MAVAKTKAPAKEKAAKADKADKGEAKAGRKAGGGLSQPVKPSPELAAIVGDKEMTRSEVVSATWDYIRKHNLQDPADKRTIVGDDKMKKVLGKDKATMFELNKHLSAHLTKA